MSTEKNLPGWVKPALEFGPVLAFFVAYQWIKDQTYILGGQEYGGFILATAGFVPIFILSILILWRLTGELSKMQVMTAVLVIVFGGLTVWLNDERFFKMKPTLIYALFGGLLAIGLLQGKSYLRMVMDQMLPMKDEGWMKLTRRFMLFFFGLAIANEVIWRGFSTDLWVNFKTFGLPILLFGFVMSQAGLISTYAEEEPEA